MKAMSSLRGFLKLLVLLSVLVCFAGPTTFIENNKWAPIGPWGGTINALIIDPQNPSRMYAGTISGVFKSLDAGQSWIESSNGLPGDVEPISLDEVTAMAIDPQNSDTLYCGKGYGGVYKSTDAGRNWTQSGNLMGEQITALAIEPIHPNVVYAGTSHTSDKMNLGGLFQSTDGGATWLQKAYWTGAEPLDVVLAPTVPATVYVILYSFACKSTDGGTTWTHLKLDQGPPSGYFITSLAINPNDSATIYAGTNGAGVFKSTDGGETWSAAKNTGLGSLRLREIAVDPGNPAGLYAETEDLGIFKSIDAGASWIAANSGLETASVKVIAIDPSDGNRVFAGTSLGVFKSANGGAAWNASNLGLNAFRVTALAIDPLRRGTIYAAAGPYSQSSLFKTTDGGTTWTGVNSGLRGLEIKVIAIDPNDSQTIYAGTGGGVFQSQNGGASWIPAGLTSLWIDALAIDSHNSAVVYAATYTKGVFKSADGGASWTSLSNGLSDFTIRALAIDPNDTATLYAGGRGHIYKSDDAGVFWQDKSTGVSDFSYITSLRIDPNNSKVVYAIDLNYQPEGSILKSENGGQTWVVAKKGFFRALAVDPVHGATVYVATEGSGVFKTTDDGLRWAPVNDGLRSLGVSTLAIDPFDSNSLYAATQTNGICRVTFGDCRVTFESGAGGRIIGSLDQVIPQGGRTSSVTAVPDPSYGLIEWTGPGGFTSTANPLILNPVFQNLTITAHFTTQPILVLSKTKLTFGSAQGRTTSPQRVLLTNRGGGAMAWTAIPSQSWITVSPSSGIRNAVLTVGVNPAGLALGDYTGGILVNDPRALNPSINLQIDLHVLASGGSPDGCFDTPLDGTTGIEGAIPVTGWAVDRIEVVNVDIWRDPEGGEAMHPNGYVYIGDAVFVEGARLDVELARPEYPLNSRAGWGYMLLTNFLPNGGNGTFRLHAFAHNRDGQSSYLGTKIITCDNAHAVLPFGTIDTPGQGGAASGTAFLNFGWAITPPPKMIPADGSTITVWVDGLPFSHPAYGFYRADIAALFPGYANSSGAIGYFYLDTTAYADGMHTIAWSVRDNAGVESGIGSRYFTIENGGNSAVQEGARSAIPDSGTIFSSPESAARDNRPSAVRRGWDSRRPAESLSADRDGVIRFKIEECERVEIELDRGRNPTGGRTSRWSGGLLVGDELRPLPVGSTLAGDIFAWQPGPGFLGKYLFQFTRTQGSGRSARKLFEVEIFPQKYGS